MKLKLNLSESRVSLKEAPDLNQGRRVQYISKFYKAFEPALKSAGYKLKIAGDKTQGFHILPPNSHLVNIKLVLNEDGAVKVYCAPTTESKDSTKNELPTIEFGKLRASSSGEDKSVMDVVETLASSIVSGCNAYLLTGDNFLSESLNEGVELNEFLGPFSAIKTLAAKVSNAKAVKAVDKRDKADREQQKKDSEEFFRKHVVESIFSAMSKSFDGFKVTKSLSNDEANISIASANGVILSVGLITSPDDVTKLTVSTLTTGDKKSKKIGKNNMSLESLVTMLSKKIKFDANAVISALKTDADTNDSEVKDDDTSTDDTKNNPFEAEAAKKYQLDAIVAGLDDSSSISAEDVITLLGENFSLHRNITLTEAKIPVSCNSNNYYDVYQEIAKSPTATVALIKRFINKGLGVSEANVEALDTDALNIYIKAICASQFVISSISNPLAYVLSAYLKKWGKLPAELTAGVHKFLSNSNNAKNAKDDVAKVKLDTTSVHKINDVLARTSSIFYCDKLALTGNVSGVLSIWFNFNHDKLTKILKSESSKALLAEVCNVEPEDLTDIESAYRAIFLKSINGSEFANYSAIKTRKDGFDKIPTPKDDTASDNATADSADPETESDSDAENTNQSEESRVLDIEELKNELDDENASVDMDSFMRSLNKIISDKNLSDDAIKTLQKSIINCFN